MPNPVIKLIEYVCMNESDLRSLYDFAAPIWFECYKDVLQHGQIDYLTHKYFDYQNVLNIKDNGMIYENIMYNDTKAGFIAYCINADHIYLDKIYLLSDFRGNHISSSAFDYLQERYSLPIRLNVNQGNAVAVRAYKGRGFEIIEEKSYPLPGGYTNVDYIMEKPFSQNK